MIGRKKAPGPVPLQLVPQLLAGLAVVARRGTRKGNLATLRDGLAIMLGLLGLRITEVRNLLVKDLRPTVPGVWVRTLKGGRNRCVPLPPDAWKLATELSDGRGATEPLLATRSGKPVNVRDLRRRWAAWVPRILGTHYRFHDLRHTAARVVAAIPGAGILAAQQMLGHRKLDTTARYLVDAQAIAAGLAAAFEPPPDFDAASLVTIRPAAAGTADEPSPCPCPHCAGAPPAAAV